MECTQTNQKLNAKSLKKAIEVLCKKDSDLEQIVNRRGKQINFDLTLFQIALVTDQIIGFFVILFAYNRSFMFFARRAQHFLILHQYLC